VFGLGSEAGAEYSPEESIVPTLVFPPAVPFTDQVTLWLEAFATAAMKVFDAPTRTLAEVGLTETVTGFAGGVLGWVLAQAIWKTRNETNRGMRIRRTMILRSVGMGLELLELGCVARTGSTTGRRYKLGAVAMRFRRRWQMHDASGARNGNPSFEGERGCCVV
jgi:hypothetical protein